MANGKRSDKNRLRAAERRLKAFELRKAGDSYRKIATALDVSVAQAHDDVNTALAELATQECASAKEYRALELERLDAILLAVWKDATKGHLGAVDRVLRISERRARLLGLDASPAVQMIKLAGMDIDQLAVLAEAMQRHDLKPHEVFQHMLNRLAEQDRQLAQEAEEKKRGGGG